MWKALVAWLPSSNALEERDWQRRHRVPLMLLVAHLPALAAICALTGRSTFALLAAVLLPAGCALLGYLLRADQRLAAVAVTLGLVSCSAALVGLTNGTIEAHFHFFIIIGFVAIYHDWVPFLCMIVFTTLSHVLGSSWQRDLIFSHEAGQANPWVWSLIHGVAVLAACVGITVLWNLTDDLQERTALARRLADAEASRRSFTSELLVNLARRNQSMLHRQLEIINQLEESERDPDTLGELFTLDHLATRVRRNAESLLVLAGEQPPRTWSEPVPIRDVLRAAIAETEDLDRVVFVADEQVAVVGHTVTDLTHLIAELTENAVRFSPPDSAVTIRVRPDRQHPGAHLLTVQDWGIGLTPAQLTAANRLLAQPPEVDLSVSHRLGFHVIARLAARHGIDVSLAATGESGVTAVIVLPEALFAEERPAVPPPAAPIERAPSTPAPAQPAQPTQPTQPDQPDFPGAGEAVATIALPVAPPLPATPAPLPAPPSLSPRLPMAEQPVAAGADPAPAADPDQQWRGWWAAELDPVVVAMNAGGPPGAEDPPAPQVPTPRPRNSSEVPQMDRPTPPAPPAAPVEPPVDPVSGLRKRIPQAHLAPELRQPTTTRPAVPADVTETANALSRYQAGQLTARTATDNEFGWRS